MISNEKIFVTIFGVILQKKILGLSSPLTAIQAQEKLE